jgi:hypothetical protein
LLIHLEPLGTTLSHSFWRRAARAAVTASFITGASLSVTGVGLAAAAPPGDNGNVKIHDTVTPDTDHRNEPHVCKFYLDAFNFDPGEQVSWQIKAWAPTGDNKTVVLKGTLTLGGDGNGRTEDLGLPDGHYKLFWNFVGEHGAAKHKTFWVDCDDDPSPSPSPSTTGTPSPSTSPSTNPSTSPSTSPSASPSTNPNPSPSTQPNPHGSPTPSTPPGGDGGDDGGDGDGGGDGNGGGGGDGGGLPFTGAPAMLMAGTGAALLLGGGAAMWISRRRKGAHHAAD